MEPHIESNEMQKKVHEWISQFKEGYWDPHVMVSTLTEEVGEVARAINHIHGPKKPKEGENEVALGDELADVLLYYYVSQTNIKYHSVMPLRKI